MVTTPVTAAELPQQDVTIQCEAIEEPIQFDVVVDMYNNNTDVVPDMVGSAVAANTTQIDIRNAQQQYYTINTDQSLRITNLEIGQTDSPDVIVVTDKETACDLYTSKNPASTFQESYADGDIEVEAKGTVNSAKVFVVEKVVEASNLIDETLSGL